MAKNVGAAVRALPAFIHLSGCLRNPFPSHDAQVRLSGNFAITCERTLFKISDDARQTSSASGIKSHCVISVHRA